MSLRASKVKAGRQILGCRGDVVVTGDEADEDEIGDQRSRDRRRGRKARDPEPQARIEVGRVRAAGGRPGAEQLDVVGFRLEPGRDP